MYVGKESMNMIISFNKEEHVTCRLHSTGKEMEHCQLGVVMGDEGLFVTLLHIYHNTLTYTAQVIPTQWATDVLVAELNVPDGF